MNIWYLSGRYNYDYVLFSVKYNDDIVLLQFNMSSSDSHGYNITDMTTPDKPTKGYPNNYAGFNNVKKLFYFY